MFKWGGSTKRAMKKIGIMGGTFDPIHKGHIRLAEDAIAQSNLDRVYFIPAYIQPFKQEQKVTEKEHRLKMLQLAVEDYDKIDVSTLELDLEGISYTYITMRKIRELHGGKAKTFFISGTDTFLKIHTWKKAEELLKENSFIVGTRPGYKTGETHACQEKYKKIYGTDTEIIDNERLDISSSDIKKKVKQGETIEGLVPKKVMNYIYEQNLYR